MATKYTFNGKLIKLAGAYSAVKSGIKNPPLSLDYGKVMIIDTGSNAGYGFGAGINGELAKSNDAIYHNIKDMETMKLLMKGGKWWKMAEYLFKPDGADSVGASEIVYAKAATTTCPLIQYTTFTNASLIKIKVRDEGLAGNGALHSGSALKSGYAAMLTAGVDDTSKYMLKFYLGTYKGMDSFNSIPYDGIADVDCAPLLVCASPEVTTHTELNAWMIADQTFNKFFKLDTYTIGQTKTIIAGDLTLLGGVWTLAAGGTESYASTDLDKVLTYIKDLDYSLILCDKYHTDACGSLNLKIEYHLLNKARFDKIMIVGGGYDVSSFAQSTDSSYKYATTYNSDSVVIVHGGIREESRDMATGFKEYPSLFKAAYVTGRLAGLPPQVPITFKSLGYSGEVHTLTTTEQELAVDYGILYTIWDNDLKKLIVGQGINSLQNNDFFMNEDGTTHSIQMKRIIAQLNKEIVINAKKQLFSNPNGVNRNTLTEQMVKDWLDLYLKARLANPIKDDLLISYSNIVVTRDQDTYHVTYNFSPNSEITKIFITGFVIN